MVSAIQFVVRDSAGGRQHGSLAGEGQGNLVRIGAGDSISLGLSQGSIVAYEQQGSDLVVRLADGRTVVIAGYFDAAATGGQLYLSTDGQLTAVALGNDGTGVLTARYAAEQGYEKWSPLDGLRLDGGDVVADASTVTDEPAGMGIFAPALLAGAGGAGAAGLVGLGLVGGLVGGGGGNAGQTEVPRGRVPPTVDNPDADDTLTTNTENPTIVVTGTGEPGDTVLVTIGDRTETTTITEGGTWGVEFEGENLPEDGEYSAVVVVTEPTGTQHTLDGPDYLIDMTPPAVTVTEGTESVGDIENLADYADGVTIAGEGEPGAGIRIEIEGITREAIIDSEGKWSFTFTQDEIAGGEREVEIRVTATDPVGNTTTVTDRLILDTVPHPLTIDPVTDNNLVNLVEHEAGFTMTGSTTANTTITLVVEASGTRIERSVTSDANGRWEQDFAKGSLPGGTYEATATISTVDAAGNASTTSHSFGVDTEIAVDIDATQAGDNRVDGAERDAGFAVTGTGEAGATITVTTATPGGTLTHGPVTVGANGQWSITYGAGELPRGTYTAEVTVTARDAAGNVTTDGHTLAVDTEVSVGIDANQAGDNTVSGAERTAGITLTGTAEPQALVEISFNGQSLGSVRADASGVWQLPVASAAIPAGTTTALVAVRATDAFGNTATATHSVNIDTEVVPLTRSTLSAGSDGIVNATEAAQGLTITGTVEAGSTVSVSFAGAAAIPAQVSGGTWSITIPAGQIPQGTTTADLVVLATDRFGNTGRIEETVRIDREVTPLQPGQEVLAGDGYLNAAEAAQGLTVTGISEPHSTVTVQIMSGTQALGQPIRITTDATGSWSATFAGDALPRGEIDAQVVVSATDLAGNTDGYSQPLVIDTVAPGAPDVIKFERVSGGLTRIVTQEVDDSYEFTRIDADGSAVAISAVRSTDIVTGDENITFGAFVGNKFNSTPVPDGSYLVIDSTDVAGNQSSTLMIVNNTNAPDIDLGRPGLSGFDFSAVDLTFAPDANLTITEAQILELTGADRTLVIKGDQDDRVEIVGGSKTGATTEIDGETYNIYTVGSSGATILLDDDIQPL